MVIGDEVRNAVVDALMVWPMGIGRMDAHRFGHDLRQRPPTAQQFVIAAAAPLLIAGEHAIFELLIEASRFLTAVCCCCGLRWHGSSLLEPNRHQSAIILAASR